MGAFLLILGEDIFQILANQTNLYARQSPPGASYNWYHTKADEKEAFHWDDSGKLHKIRPRLDIIQQNIQSSYNPHREISIDEAMVGFKGRSSLKQYMPLKPTKRGFKIWCLCDSTNGYTYSIIIHTGASSALENGGLGPTVVI